jgi:hypothetical protein
MLANELMYGTGSTTCRAGLLTVTICDLYSGTLRPPVQHTLYNNQPGFTCSGVDGTQGELLTMTRSCVTEKFIAMMMPSMIRLCRMNGIKFSATQVDCSGKINIPARRVRLSEDKLRQCARSRQARDNAQAAIHI